MEVVDEVLDDCASRCKRGVRTQLSREWRLGGGQVGIQRWKVNCTAQVLVSLANSTTNAQDVGDLLPLACEWSSKPFSFQSLPCSPFCPSFNFVLHSVCSERAFHCLGFNGKSTKPGNYWFYKIYLNSRPSQSRFLTKSWHFKGGIFIKCNVAWPQYRFFVFDSLYGISTQLERHNLLVITRDVITKAD